MEGFVNHLGAKMRIEAVKNRGWARTYVTKLQSRVAGPWQWGKRPDWQKIDADFHIQPPRFNY